LSVSIDRGSTENVRKTVKDYVDGHNLTFMNLLDPGSDVAFPYGVQGIPISFLIDTQGKVVAVARGYREWNSEEGRKVIEQLLSETN
jgi:peroxiredoxin